MTSAGIVIHQFDSLDDGNPDGTPWVPRRPTISAAIVNADLQPDPDRGNIPVYSYSLAGLVLRGSANKLRCSYAFDTGSLRWHGACNKWRCSDTESTDSHSAGGCAFNPSGLQRMMEVQKETRIRNFKPWFKPWDDHKFYNECILDDRTFLDSLPRSIAAVFYMPTPCDDIYDGPKCEAYARGAHRNMLRHFELTEADLPLVRFDFYNWTHPFEVAPNCDPSATGVFSCGPTANAAIL